MRKKTKYTDEPLGELEILEDFLPPPDQLVLKDESIKVTISLSKSSVEFFKRAARQNETQYQRMIRRVLDLYVSRFREKFPTSRSRRRSPRGRR
jgi:predicted DNA binding CopG/RHH family protein